MGQWNEHKCSQKRSTNGSKRNLKRHSKSQPSGRHMLKLNYNFILLRLNEYSIENNNSSLEGWWEREFLYTAPSFSFWNHLKSLKSRNNIWPISIVSEYMLTGLYDQSFLHIHIYSNILHNGQLWTQLRGLLRDEWIRTMWHTLYKMDYNSAINNENRAWQWWWMPLIPELGRRRQPDLQSFF